MIQWNKLIYFRPRHGKPLTPFWRAGGNTVKFHFVLLFSGVNVAQVCVIFIKLFCCWLYGSHWRKSNANYILWTMLLPNFIVVLLQALTMINMFSAFRLHTFLSLRDFCGLHKVFFFSLHLSLRACVKHMCGTLGKTDSQLRYTIQWRVFPFADIQPVIPVFLFFCPFFEIEIGLYSSGHTIVVDVLRR